jgi:hypothetical protein
VILSRERGAASVVGDCETLGADNHLGERETSFAVRHRCCRRSRVDSLAGRHHAHFKVPVADVAAEFRTDDFRVIPLVNLPVNVAAVCLLTWMCAPSPVGPNIHANTLGYRVIADAFVDSIGPVLRTG